MSSSSGVHFSGVNAIVERQMRNWELGRLQRRQEPEHAQPVVADFITISRELGCGGHEVARLVAERLGWPMFDKEILDLMAEHDEVRRQVYQSLDERDLSWLEESLRSFMDPSFSRNDFFHRLSETILSLARQASAVFLGRGAEYILPRTHGFRVRFVAPLDSRIRHHARRKSIPEAQAGAEVLRLDRERRDYIAKYFKTDPSDPLRADIIVNMSRYSPASAAELVLAARKLAGHQPE